ncbi:MAG: hypothetical protein KA408_04075 [Flavobacteriales bacterium]|nr:hypothetical protein [Flavobacteriales bacterium]
MSTQDTKGSGKNERETIGKAHDGPAVRYTAPTGSSGSEKARTHEDQIGSELDATAKDQVENKSNPIGNGDNDRDREEERN